MTDDNFQDLAPWPPEITIIEIFNSRKYAMYKILQEKCLNAKGYHDLPKNDNPLKPQTEWLPSIMKTYPCPDGLTCPEGNCRILDEGLCENLSFIPYNDNSSGGKFYDNYPTCNPEKGDKDCPKSFDSSPKPSPLRSKNPRFKCVKKQNAKSKTHGVCQPTSRYLEWGKQSCDSDTDCDIGSFDNRGLRCNKEGQCTLETNNTAASPAPSLAPGFCKIGNFFLKRWCELPNTRNTSSSDNEGNVPPFKYFPETSDCQITSNYCDYMVDDYYPKDSATCKILDRCGQCCVDDGGGDGCNDNCYLCSSKDGQKMPKCVDKPTCYPSTAKQFFANDLGFGNVLYGFLSKCISSCGDSAVDKASCAAAVLNPPVGGAARVIDCIEGHTDKTCASGNPLCNPVKEGFELPQETNLSSLLRQVLHSMSDTTNAIKLVDDKYMKKSKLIMKDWCGKGLHIYIILWKDSHVKVDPSNRMYQVTVGFKYSDIKKTPYKKYIYTHDNAKFLEISHNKDDKTLLKLWYIAKYGNWVTKSFEKIIEEN
jgi:hypothetical protein